MTNTRFFTDGWRDSLDEYTYLKTQFTLLPGCPLSASGREQRTQKGKLGDKDKADLL